MALSDIADIAKKQGVPAAVALMLAGALVYMSKQQSDALKAQAAATMSLAESSDALGDLVISSCDPTKEDVQKFEARRRASRR